MRRALSTAGHDVLEAETYEEAASLLATRAPDCAVLDLFLGQRADGVEVARLAATSSLRPAIVVVTGMADTGLGLDLGRIGVDTLLNKPFTTAELLSKVETLLARRGAGEQAAGGLGEALGDLRQRMVSEAFLAAGGNKTLAAARLGISRQNLQLLVRRGHVTLPPMPTDGER